LQYIAVYEANPPFGLGTYLEPSYNPGPFWMVEEGAS